MSEYQKPSVDTIESTLPFSDLNAGGKIFANHLYDQFKNDDLVVLGLAMGGVPVAYEVAQKFHAPFDLIFIRRLLAPDGPGSQTCAFTVAGSLVLDAGVQPLPPEPVEPLDYFLLDAIGKLKQRTQLCRGSRPPLELLGKDILLVDCGIRTALSMQAAIGALRQLQVNRIIAAAPVVSPESIETMKEIADEFIYLAAPEAFGNVGVWYKTLNRPTEESVASMLSTA